MSTRRKFVQQAALLGAVPLASCSASMRSPASTEEGAPAPVRLPSPPAGAPDQVARDESFWSKVADQYRIKNGVMNMEAGYFGMMSLPVLAAYHRNIDIANRDSSYFARREYPLMMQQVRERVATFVGAQPSEITFSRNATEALQALIGQYNRLKTGDTIMYADLDYNAMQWAMNGLAQRTGTRVVTLDIPEPASRVGILEAYTRALDANPRTRLLLLTHCNNKTGLLLPVRDIVAIARPRGIDVIVDAAHSFGQVPLSIAELDGDFVGLNLHKWVGAPVGAGVMYIKSEKLAAIDRAHADESAPITSIDSRLHTGTTNFATLLTVPDALDFQAAIGVENKAARLRFLRDKWVHAVRDVPGVDILTPEDRQLVGAITGFRIRNGSNGMAPSQISRTLLDQYGIFTTTRSGLARGDCVRVTPALYNSVADADRMAAAIKAIAASA